MFSGSDEELKRILAEFKEKLQEREIKLTEVCRSWTNYILKKNEKIERAHKKKIGIGKSKGADQLCSKCTADQGLCFHHMDSTIPFLHKSKFSSF